MTGQPEPDSADRLRARDSGEPGIQSTERCSNRSRSSPAAASTRFASSAAGRATACSSSGPPTRPGRTVIAGPAEATALGNIGLQMMATGAVGSLCRGARGHRSVVPGRTVRADRRGSVGCANIAGSSNTWSSPVPETASTDDQLPAEPLGRGAKPSTLAAHPLELLRYRSNLLGADLRITNFGGGNTSSKFTLPDPLTGEPVACAGGEGQRRRPAIDRRLRLRRAVPRQARAADRALSRRSARRRDGRASIRCARSARTAWRRRSTRRCTRSCRSITSTTCTRTGASRWRPAPTADEAGRSSTRGTGGTIVWVPVAAPGLRAGHDAAPRGRRASRMRRHPARQSRPLHVGRRRSTSAI